MAVKSTEVKFRTSPQVKREAKAVCDSWGLPFNLGPSARLDLLQVSAIEPDPDTGLTILPAETNALGDEGLYDDFT